MKICIAQTKPISGEILGNIEKHLQFIHHGVAQGADVIVFPELSLTGYEPALAKALATSPFDARLDRFQTISNTNAITIGVGLPTSHHEGVRISMIVFRPGQPRQVYSKKYLHPDEEPFFVKREVSGWKGNLNTIALAICYELSVPEHAEEAFTRGTEIYLASVAKVRKGVNEALVRLAEIAKTYSMTVLMANSVGSADGGICKGTSSIWNSNGVLLGQLNTTDEGFLIIDTATQAVTEKYL
jgi:predicted amidohydrolase